MSSFLQENRDLKEGPDIFFTMIETWYRGYDKTRPAYGVPPGWGMWLTDNKAYADEYPAREGFPPEDRSTMSIDIDTDNLRLLTEADVYDLELDPWMADPDTCRIVWSLGYDGWLCHYDDADASGLCLVNPENFLRNPNKNRNTMSQKKTASPGSVSHGTLRNEDLFQAFLFLLFSLDPDGCREFKKDHPSLLRALCDKECGIDNDYWETEEASFDLEDLFDAMETYAPEGHTFSSHPGDGSDFGYWPVDNI